ncbi:methyltransferase [Actinoplanes sp. NPDC049596]|uniref:Eco57I restriction-modification methylase domain-containing protein n=1 Tax=unclassified Actinoplanes TaxID=2626549 RepID=UPI003432698F
MEYLGCETVQKVVNSEFSLVNLAVALGACDFGGPLSASEEGLVRDASEMGETPSSGQIDDVRTEVAVGGDPLGRIFYSLRDAGRRRNDGAVYTPDLLVAPMVEWTLGQEPSRVVDVGSGSGRFLTAIARARPEVTLVGVDLDPLATLMTRASLAVLGAKCSQVFHSDYTLFDLPSVEGTTAFIGNPPYVRHHQIPGETKAWAQTASKRLGHKISGLAGLHAYFFLATALYGRPGDVGSFVTSAEWLDVNYGAIVRTLLLEDLGGESVHVVEPRVLPFEEAQTTAVVTNFRIGQRPDIVKMRSVSSLAEMRKLASEGIAVSRQRLMETPRWSSLLRSPDAVPEGMIELGELCRVHRGAVTGDNSTWVLRHKSDLPESVLYASVTKARELFAAGDVLRDATSLRKVIDIPQDLDLFERDDRQKIEKFIKAAKRAGVDKGYIASHRRAWWSVGLKHPAPILATYMARRPPAFVINEVDARHINIAHGLYPRQALDVVTLGRLAEALRAGVTVSQGRVYAGGLTKFEPKEMERLLVPDLDRLSSHEPLTTPLDS